MGLLELQAWVLSRSCIQHPRTASTVLMLVTPRGPWQHTTTYFYFVVIKQNQNNTQLSFGFGKPDKWLAYRMLVKTHACCSTSPSCPAPFFNCHCVMSTSRVKKSMYFGASQLQYPLYSFWPTLYKFNIYQNLGIGTWGVICSVFQPFFQSQSSK